MNMMPMNVGEEPMMDGDMNGNDVIDSNNEMQNNLDGEEDGPKKNIQRLAGKLSQELRMYNDEQTSPDTDLNKYVVGMVTAQAGKNMTSKEKQEIIKKIQNGEDIDDSEETDVPMEESKQNNVMDDERIGKRFNKNAVDLKKNPFSSNR